MKNNRQTLWLSIIFMIVGITFLLWGGRVYRAYPGMEEARKLMWVATKSAGFQYIIGFVTLIGGYIYLRIKEK